MSTIKVNFEIGHEASIRTKKTPEGFTHDWEVFVRGIDSADISLFIDKVVFLLHETFPKPKRVVKEPPYAVRESGYAGFNLPIEIYLKNRDEPKKIKFNYDLHLQQSGPPIIKVQKEKYVFNNPSDEFKRKLLKGGGMVVPNTNLFTMHPNIDHERSRDSFTDEKLPQLIGKPKLSGDSAKKHKSKEHRMDELPRPTNSFVNLFGPPIHKTSRTSPDPKKPSPNPKVEKKEKDKSHIEKDKMKTKHESKDKEENKYKEDKPKSSKEEREKLKEEKKSNKSHKERDASKEKSSKRPAERPPSPAPPPKKSAPLPAPPSPKPNILPPPKEEIKPNKYCDVETKNKLSKSETLEYEKKSKKDKKSHEKDRETKKEHKKEAKINNLEREMKLKDTPSKEAPPPVKEKEKPVEKKTEKPFNKFSIENMLKDPTESKHKDSSKHKDKSDKERKHKHKKKDKKRDESREKSKESSNKEKKHKHEKHSHKEKYSESKETVAEKPDPLPTPREIDKPPVASKSYKEKDRNQLTISPICVDTSSQSSSKSITKRNKSNKSSVMISTQSCSSNSESEVSMVSEDEDMSVNSESNSKSSKLSSKILPEPVKIEPVKQEPLKVERHTIEKNGSPSTSHKSKNKDKSSKHESKADKKSKKRKSGMKDESDNVSKVPKTGDEENAKNKHSDSVGETNTSTRIKAESSPHVKTDTKVQDDGVSSSLSDHPLKCDSPLSEDTSQVETNRKQISPDYMRQLKELQQRIMTIQSNDELERVVNLIAETGKYEVTKKTFDFDLCLLDRSTVQQLQELIGCESRA